ncbi:putative GPI transamidase subunit PIG-U [Blattamonas nauphoetae]|uniref:GPI transamidase subunit PIG-U n=1 Tax=Blattamonas nauphoetae TaxID=2049346 RepID=A0ABQ9YLQ7_9EUKA|nr:putative GPI transamidase subunit PIG-U [Blattamonas nauphoetae]
MRKPSLIHFLLAFCVRIGCFFLSSYIEGDLLEFVSPVHANRLIREGAYLSKQGINPYSVNYVHSHPMVMFLSEFLPNLPLFHLAFTIFCELLSYLALSQISTLLSKRCSSREKKEVQKENTNIFSKGCHIIPLYVFLFVPFHWFFAAARSFYPLLLLLQIFSVFFAVSGKHMLTLLFLALMVSIDIYQILLVVPTLFLLQHFQKRMSKPKSKQNSHSQSMNLSRTLLDLLLFLVLYGFILVGGYLGLRSLSQSGIQSPELTASSPISLLNTQGFFKSFAHSCIQYPILGKDSRVSSSFLWYFRSQVGYEEHFLVYIIQLLPFAFTTVLLLRFSYLPLELYICIYGLLVYFSTNSSIAELGLFFTMTPINQLELADSDCTSYP